MKIRIYDRERYIQIGEKSVAQDKGDKAPNSDIIEEEVSSGWEQEEEIPLTLLQEQ